MLPTLILGAVFLTVVLLVFAVAMLMRDKSVSQMEDRLNTLTGKGDGRAVGALSEAAQILAAQKGEAKGMIAEALARRFNLTRLFEQADVAMPLATFLAICGGMGIGSTFLSSMNAGPVGTFWPPPMTLPFFT